MSDNIEKKISTRVIGAAGEHYVVSQILRRGHLAALAPDGAPNSDIIVTDIESKKLCAIQVKTRQESAEKMSWRMNKKHKNIFSKNLYYCFVALEKYYSEPITTYIVPYKVVAEVVKLNHETWLKGVKRNGEKRKDTPIRLFSTDYYNGFKNTPYENKYKFGWMDKYKKNWESVLKS